MEVQLAKLEGNVKRIDHEIIEIKKDLEKQDSLLERMVNTNTSIAVLTEQMKTLTNEIKNISIRIKKLEEKPQQYIETIMTALMTGVIGYLLAYFL